MAYGSSISGDGSLTNTAVNGSNNDEITHNPMAFSDKALLARQREVLKQQDLTLLDIEKGVNRLHEQVCESRSVFIKNLSNVKLLGGDN